MRRAFIIITFGFGALFTFWLLHQFLQGQIEGLVPSNNGVVNDVLLVASYGGLSMVAYFIALNLIPLIGIFVSWKMSNLVDAKTYSLLTFIVGTLTIIYFAVNW